MLVLLLKRTLNFLLTYGSAIFLHIADWSKSEIFLGTGLRKKQIFCNKLTLYLVNAAKMNLFYRHDRVWTLPLQLTKLLQFNLI